MKITPILQMLLLLILTGNLFSQTTNAENAYEGEMMQVTVTLASPATSAIQYRCVTSSATATVNLDFAYKDIFLDFENGEQTKTFDIEVFNDSVREDDEYFILILYQGTTYINDVKAIILRPINDPSLRFYVDIDAIGAEDGLSWGNAFTDPQDVFDIILHGDEVWIAEGIYYPSQPNTYFDYPSGPPAPDARDPSFHLKKSISILGGFNGTENQAHERDISQYKTIFDGDLGVPGDVSDNALTILLLEIDSLNVVNEFSADGLIFRNGNADLSVTANRRADWHFRGGAVYIYMETNINFNNCEFINNNALEGGAIFNVSAYSNSLSKLELTNCLFDGNSASSGSTLKTFYCENVISQCIFINETATNSGVIQVGTASTMDFRNSLIKNVNAQNGVFSVVHSSNYPGYSLINIRNSIIWNYSGILTTFSGNNSYIDIGYSLIQDGNEDGNVVLPYRVTGSDNLDRNPMLQEDFSLSICSPAINKGNNSVPHEISDYSGNSRIIISKIDMGPFEFQGNPNQILYVDKDATGCANGMSWENADTTFLDVLEVADLTTEIWVADGVYKPFYDKIGNNQPADPRAKTFLFEKDMHIYGGFTGVETSRSERDFNVNKTVLSGDIGAVNVESDNAYHVVLLEQNPALTLGSDFLLDGFTIRDGAASANDENRDKGGGILVINSQNGNTIAPTISNCIIKNNSAWYGGGGMVNLSQNYATVSTRIENTRFLENYAGLYAGAMFNNGAYAYCSPQIFNCTFWNNTTNVAHQYTSGGAIYNIGLSGSCTPLIMNSSFNGNIASEGGAIMNVNVFGNCKATIRNSIFWGNNDEISNTNGGQSTLHYSILNDGNENGPVTLPIGTSGNFNLDSNPKFVNPAAGNLNLYNCSPAIDSGDGFAASSSNTTLRDIDGNDRFFISGIIDRGAFEIQDLNRNVLYVNGVAGGTSSGYNWLNAYESLDEALASEVCPNAELWLAQGKYLPTKDANGNIPVDEREKVFLIDHDMTLVGGFNGSEIDRSSRNWISNPTILSGDLGVLGDDNDNAYILLKVVPSLLGTPTILKVDGVSVE